MKLPNPVDISALHRKGFGKLLNKIKSVLLENNILIPTSEMKNYEAEMI